MAKKADPPKKAAPPPPKPPPAVVAQAKAEKKEAKAEVKAAKAAVAEAPKGTERKAAKAAVETAKQGFKQEKKEGRAVGLTGPQPTRVERTTQAYQKAQRDANAVRTSAASGGGSGRAMSSGQKDLLQKEAEARKKNLIAHRKQTVNQLVDKRVNRAVRKGTVAAGTGTQVASDATTNGGWSRGDGSGGGGGSTTSPTTSVTTPKPVVDAGPQQGKSRDAAPKFRGQQQKGGGGGNKATGGAQGITRVASPITGGSAGQAENRKGQGRYRFV